MLLCPGPTQPQAAAQALHPLATSAPDPDPPTRSQISGGELLQLIATMLTLRWGQILLGNPKLDSGESLDAIRAAGTSTTDSRKWQFSDTTYPGW